MLDIRSLAALAACLLCLAPASTFAQDASTERLRIHGSNTLGAQLMPSMVQSWLAATGYEKIRRRFKSADLEEIHAERDGLPLIVEIEKRGSAAGMADLIDGNTELAMMARQPSAREIDSAWQLGDLGSSDQEYVIALDGIAVIVHADNPVRQLSVGQLRSVYAGAIHNWSELGGPDLPIRLHVASLRTASGEFFREAVMATERLAVHADVDIGVVQVAAAVAADPASIGIVGLRSRISRQSRPLAISSGGLSLYPTALAVSSEDYPLMRRYTLYGGQLMSALGRSFALYSTSRIAQEAVAAAGHFAVTLRPAAQLPLPAANTEYSRLVAGAQRLPLSLRFNGSGTQSIFDSRADNDLERLVAFIKMPANHGKNAVVVAFGNPEKDGGLVSTLISNDRADIVAAYLLDHGVAVRSANGLGTVRPLATPAERGARFRNERVEVWLL